MELKVPQEPISMFEAEDEMERLTEAGFYPENDPKAQKLKAEWIKFLTAEAIEDRTAARDEIVRLMDLNK